MVGEAVRHGRAWSYLVSRGGGLRNFGDELSPLVVQEVTGKGVRRSSLASASLLGIGSLLSAAADVEYRGSIFGSGLRDGGVPAATLAQARVVSLRGLLTRDSLRAPSDTPVGDPGLIVRQMWPRSGSKRGGGLFVPHFALPQSAYGRDLISLASRRGMRIAFPTVDPKEMARHISAADFVVTNSLHAHIFAHSYGVPTQLVEVSANAEPSFKYQDYLSIFGVRASPLPIRDVLQAPVTASIERLAEETATIAKGLPGAIEAIYLAGQRI